MKKIILALAAALSLFSCGPKNSFTISGQIEGGEGKTLYLNRLQLNSQVPIDSVKLDKKGEFKLKGVTSDPTFYLLKFTDRDFVTLILDSSENVTLKGHYPNLAFNYEVEGSLNSELVRRLSLKYNETKGKLDSLRSLYTKNMNNPLYSSSLEGWNNEYLALTNNYSDYATGFVKTNPFSPASIYALYQKWDNEIFVINDFPVMRTAASALSSIYPKNEHVKALYNNTADLLKRQKNEKLNQFITQAAVNSPDINLPDQNGITQRLSALHGKTVLLQFWSANDRTSRIQNEVLNELYAKYKNRGFEIYMVSVDTNEEVWKRAIAEDNLTWINVGDMKGSFQAVNNYNIQVIPSNYLLDKEGNIVGKNLQGPALTQALAKFIK